MATRDDQAIIFRPGEPYYAQIKAGIARTGLPDGHAITQILLAALGESELLEQLKRARKEGGKLTREGVSTPPKGRGA